MKKILFLITILVTQQLNAEQKWYITDPNGFGFYLTTHSNNNKIEGYTRKNALKNIVGWTKFTLIKMTTSIKHPEIIHFKAGLNDNTFSGVYQNLFNTSNFTGKINGDKIKLIINTNNNQKSHLSGIKVTGFHANRNYLEIFNQIFKLTEDNIYQQSFIKTKQWLKFKKKMLKHAAKIKDDLELQIAFYAIVRDFPFSHYQLIKKPYESIDTTNQPTSNYAKLVEIDKKTVVLDIDYFKGTKQSMLDLIKQIDDKQYRNLIIDLRDNPGGNFLTAYPLSQYLIAKPIIAGIFPNQKWYKQHDRAPNHEEYSQFSEFSGGTTEEWLQLASEKFGVYYKSYPSKSHFDGVIYVLTNNRTASTCEPLVYALKQKKIATIVGENTQGAMLSMNQFEIDYDILLGIPVNDYITYSGQRIDGIGIAPDVEVKSDLALDKVIALINQN